jgi:hypothetical protein
MSMAITNPLSIQEEKDDGGQNFFSFTSSPALKADMLQPLLPLVLSLQRELGQAPFAL